MGEDHRLPLGQAAWVRVDSDNKDDQVWTAMDRKLACTVSRFPDPVLNPERGLFLVTIPRPDGWYDHLYGPSLRVLKLMVELGADRF